MKYRKKKPSWKILCALIYTSKIYMIQMIQIEICRSVIINGLLWNMVFFLGAGSVLLNHAVGIDCGYRTAFLVGQEMFGSGHFGFRGWRESSFVVIFDHGSCRESRSNNKTKQLEHCPAMSTNLPLSYNPRASPGLSSNLPSMGEKQVAQVRDLSYWRIWM